MFAKALLVSALATSALAQSSYMTGLLDALRNNGATNLADVLGSFDNTTLATLESSLSQGNHTLFVPNNDALSNLSTSNTTQVQQILSYHILSGIINTTDTSPDKYTIARTTLTGAPTVNLRMFLSLHPPILSRSDPVSPQRVTSLRSSYLVKQVMVISWLSKPPLPRTSLRARTPHTRTCKSR